MMSLSAKTKVNVGTYFFDELVVNVRVQGALERKGLKVNLVKTKVIVRLDRSV